MMKANSISIKKGILKERINLKKIMHWCIRKIFFAVCKNCI